MPTPLSITTPYSMRPWFALRVALAITSPTPVAPAILARALNMNGVTPDQVRVAYTRRSIMNPRLQTTGILHLIYGDRDYYFAYDMKNSGEFTLPKYMPTVVVNRHVRAGELTDWLTIYCPRPNFIERLSRLFAFREK